MTWKPFIDLFRYIVETKQKLFAMMLLVLVIIVLVEEQHKFDLRNDKKELNDKCRNYEKQIEKLNSEKSNNNADCQEQIAKLNEANQQRYDLLDREFKTYVKTTNEEFKAISKSWEQDYKNLVKRFNKYEENSKSINHKIKL